MGTYVFTPLNFATANSGTYASGINNAGQIVGYYVDSTGQDHDFLYSDGTFSTLAVPGTVDGNVGLGINSSGQVVGTYANGSIDQGFILSGSVFTTISDPTASLTFAAGINDASQIVGDVYVTFFESGTGYFGYLYSGGNYTQIQDPLTGEQVDSGRVYGTFPSTINAAGQIVGTFRDFENASHGFVYSNGTYTTLDDPSQGTLDGIGAGTFATGINNSGEIVGYYIDSSRVDHGFIYDDGVYTTVDVPGATDTFIYGINDSDEIVGSFVTGTTPEGFSATLQNPGNVNTDEWMLANGHWSASISPGPHPFGYGWLASVTSPAAEPTVCCGSTQVPAMLTSGEYPMVPGAPVPISAHIRATIKSQALATSLATAPTMSSGPVSRAAVRSRPTSGNY